MDNCCVVNYTTRGKSGWGWMNTFPSITSKVPNVKTVSNQMNRSSSHARKKKTNRTNNSSQTDSQCVLHEMTKCLGERRRQLNVRREECLRISVHYGFQNGPFIMMCAESRKRAIKVTTICLSLPPKSWHSDCLKGKTTQLKNSYNVPPAWQ